MCGPLNTEIPFSADAVVFLQIHKAEIIILDVYFTETSSCLKIAAADFHKKTCPLSHKQSSLSVTKFHPLFIASNN